MAQPTSKTDIAYHQLEAIKTLHKSLSERKGAATRYIVLSQQPVDHEIFIGTVVAVATEILANTFTEEQGHAILDSFAHSIQNNLSEGK